MEESAKIARRIRKSCETLGTYKPEFDPVITRLGELIQRKADAETLFRKSGGQIIIEQTNKGGAKYLTRSPFLSEIDAANTQILALEKELGLTPAALKKIRDEQLAKSDADDPLAAAISNLRVIRGA